ncbi:MAG: glycine betaine/L-proline ABC transporter permease ProW [Neisseria sp.]|uniref:glycine betaine/L-proline ABC transporter permease ProW n=1 Tax=Neisseria sp. TaxID=192066 RepID=UPI0026DD8F31|nr:glycine betaine/L-proline ABC transporter permease ProW [Neisseria sp.]MDO4641992.1 glycine betaine/L-proline ABC transporter permease ProW [Neisseria sp.]
MSSDNPWGTAQTASEGAASAAASTPAADTASVLSAGHSAEQPFSLLKPFDHARLPLDKWVEQSIEWVVQHFRGFFTAVKAPIDWTLTSIESILQSVPPLLLIAIMALLAWQLSGKKLALGTLVGLLLIGFIGAWPETVTTLSLVLTAVLFCMLIGIPTGIVMARSERVGRILRPLLDAMQTTPAFVYLVPIVMLFGIGNVPGVVVTIIFAVPPVIRLTNLGIRQVPEDLIEAAHSFGADTKQMLLKVQLPLALPTIMAGVNQTLMLSLSMVVIASMISVGGLGLMVLRGIGRLDIGLASVGGLGIVIMAIVLDRMTQSLGRSNRSRADRWYLTGPVGLVMRPFLKRKTA